MMTARTALVIDDEPQIRRVVRHALAEDFARILEAESGSKGIDLAAAERPALIVLDLGLPDMDGTEVYARLRVEDPMLPVIFATGHGDRRAILDGLADTRARFLQKPFEAEMLLSMIDEFRPRETE